jgi:hypothetical protein
MEARGITSGNLRRLRSWSVVGFPNSDGRASHPSRRGVADLSQFLCIQSVIGMSLWNNLFQSRHA